MTEKTATRGLIIEAVIDCIEKYGIDKVTTRRIAEQAGTNIASINYYFRSKDVLLAAAEIRLQRGDPREVDGHALIIVRGGREDKNCPRSGR